MISLRMIICGGRDYWLSMSDFNALNSLKEINDIVEVVSGGCPTGVDNDAEQWASANRIPIKRFEAQWDKFGKNAGPIRNEAMAKYANCTVAFSGGRGTADMVGRATKYNHVLYDFRSNL